MAYLRTQPTSHKGQGGRAKRRPFWRCYPHAYYPHAYSGDTHSDYTSAGHATDYTYLDATCTLPWRCLAYGSCLHSHGRPAASMVAVQRAYTVALYLGMWGGNGGGAEAADLVEAAVDAALVAGEDFTPSAPSPLVAGPTTSPCWPCTTLSPSSQV